MHQNSASLEVASNQPNPIALATADAAADAPTSIQFISFAVGGNQYGVDIMAVREIKGWTDITHLPNQPEYIRGVLNLRGVIIPIIDLRCRFGQSRTETTPQHIMIIVQIDGRQVGLIGDRVIDIVSAESAAIHPVPRATQGASADFLSGLVNHDDTMIALIDLPQLLSDIGGDDADRAAGESKPAVPMPSN